MREENNNPSNHCSNTQKDILREALKGFCEVCFDTSGEIPTMCIGCDETPELPAKNIVIGLLLLPTLKTKSIAFENLHGIDGLITQSNALADEINLSSLIPAKAIMLPQTFSKNKTYHFVQELKTFVKTVRRSSVVKTAMTKVCAELKYLAIDEKSSVVDSISATLSNFL